MEENRSSSFAPDSVAAVLASLDLLCALNERQIETLAKYTHRRELARGEILFQEESPAEAFFLLRSGQVKLFMLSRHGEEKVMQVVQPGSTFAEGVAFMQDPVYPVNAQALIASDVWAIHAQTLRALLSESFPTCLKLLERQTLRIRSLLQEVEAHALESAHHRLIAYLLRQVEAGDTLSLPTSKVLIAAQLAIKPETLSRLLSGLQHRGLIEMHAREVRILDRRALFDLALEPVLRG